MNDARADLLAGFETHSVERIQRALSHGIDPNGMVNGKTPLVELIEMYYRSEAFSDCVRCLIRFGARHSDTLLMAVLTDEAEGLVAELKRTPSWRDRRVDLACAFTPLLGASLLHVACEFGLYNSAKVLLESGAEVESRAALDSFGFNGHTPIFHTVNQHRNHGLPVLRLLLSHGARADWKLSGITWGKGFEWETTIFDPTPVSYAQFGLLKQFQRDEGQIYETIRELLKSMQRPVPHELNVPNKYLSS